LLPTDVDGDGKPNAYDLDSDGDGINDVKENTATAALDPDNDGKVNGVDTDGDGIINVPTIDNNATFGGTFPANLTDADNNGTPDYIQAIDADRDGVADYIDLDDDNDGILDTEEGFTDIDGDGIPSYLDLDSDNDGILDIVEANGTDTNNDGKADGTINPANGIAASAGTGLTPPDTDNDGRKDYKDLDSDNDGLSDVSEANGTDADNNGRADGLVNASGVAASAGATGLTPPDTDNDGKGDYRDLDSDGDGMSDVLEAGGLDASRDGLADGIPNIDGQPISIALTFIDTDSDGIPDQRDLDSDNDGIFDVLENIPTSLTDANNDGKVDGTDTDNDGIVNVPSVDNNNIFGGTFSAPTDSDNNNIPNYKQPLAIQANIKVLLQGAGTPQSSPYTANADGMMRTDLKAILPTVQPYTTLGFSNVKVKVGTPNFTGTGNNAIVDWVIVELRSAASSSTVVARQAGLLQKDGDIVDIDGVSPLAIEISTGNYFVSVRHRNHLGAMTATAIAMTASPTAIDFTNPATATYGTNAQVTIGTKKYLWAGNANGNNNVIAQGANSDRSTSTNEVANAAANLLGSNSYIVSGYLTSDVNMDGKAIAKGTNADNTTILNIALGHPNNASGSNLFIISQQLP
jgi:hypothetical protein